MPASTIWPALIAGAALVSAAPTSIGMGDALLPRGLSEDPIPQCGAWAGRGQGNLDWQNRRAAWYKYGDPAGSDFCASAWPEGKTIHTIKVFKEFNGKNCDEVGGLVRIEVNYSHPGGKVAIGSDDTRCPAGEIDIGPEDIITQFGTTVARYNDRAVGAIFIKKKKSGTDQEDEYILNVQDKVLEQSIDPIPLVEYANQNPWLPVDYQELRGGILLGLTGHTDTNNGGIITQLTGQFTPGVLKKASRGNMQFDLQKLQQAASIEKFNLDTQDFINPGDIPKAAFKYSKSISKTQSVKNMASSTTTFGVTIEITEKFSFPGIVELESKQGFSFTTANTVEKSVEQAETASFSADYTGEIKAHKGVRCTAYTGKATGKMPYTATVWLEFEGGSKWKYPVSDELDAIQVLGSFSRTQCEEIDIGQAQGDAYNVMNPS